MLVLTRRIGEEIVIGGDIRVTVLEVHGNKVRIGVEAPKSVRVDRQEIHDRRVEFAVGAKCGGNDLRGGNRYGRPDPAVLPVPGRPLGRPPVTTDNDKTVAPVLVAGTRPTHGRHKAGSYQCENLQR